jgi:hypothetical protein
VLAVYINPSVFVSTFLPHYNFDSKVFVQKFRRHTSCGERLCSKNDILNANVGEKEEI